MNIANLFGGSLLSGVKGIIGAFKLDPAKKAELESILDQQAGVLAEKQLELDSKIADQVAAEIAVSADIIKVEAGSQSWLPKNVRPLLLLLWGCIITFNPLVAIISQFTKAPMQPITLDPWIYKLTAIGFTGYVAFRSWEKVKDADK